MPGRAEQPSELSHLTSKLLVFTVTEGPTYGEILPPFVLLIRNNLKPFHPCRGRDTPTPPEAEAELMKYCSCDTFVSVGDRGSSHRRTIELIRTTPPVAPHWSMNDSLYNTNMLDHL